MNMAKEFAATPPSDERPPKWGIRLCVLVLAALTVSLPIALISIAKVLLFLYGLVYLIVNQRNTRHRPILPQLWTSKMVLVALIVFAISLCWTEAEQEAALSSYVKHAKLMGILLIVSLIQSVKEARIALQVFAAGQVFLLLSSWMMFLGLPVPWAADSPTKYVVFSTYLDQSIMFATSAAVFWHLRKDGLWPNWMAVAMASLGLVNALLLLEGRTGYLVALTSLSLALMWAMPKRLRLATLIAAPLLILLSLSLGSAQVKERVSKVVQESQDYAKADHVSADSSSGWRLNAWRRSLQAISEKPINGYGVGAWTPVVKRLEGSAALKLFGEGNHSNPHQEYLLWGVELGIGGLLLFVAFLVCVARDALRFPLGIQYATLSVLAAMAVACLFNSTLYDDWIGDFFCVSLGLLLALGARSAPPAVASPPQHQTALT